MDLTKLFSIITKRKNESSKDSYTASLCKKGRDGIVQKIGEEAVEVIIAAKNESKKRIIEEVADLFYHVLVLLAFLNIDIKEVYKELERRNKK